MYYCCAQWALQDLDNLRCDTTGNGHCGDAMDFQGRPNGPEHTTAELTLKNMLIYGQCFDAKLGNYAHGLQVTVRPSASHCTTGNPVYVVFQRDDSVSDNIMPYGSGGAMGCGELDVPHE